MLKRLELIGFKSFADRTVFDFAAGITAVVGPNGSGKSNVVDAVKWVLGEQSAKSLRGGEMADVIFNGSASRKGLSVAEVSLTFDNSKSLLAIAAAEVCVTRRVYRDGQGEYLLNGQPCRLRDIKDLLLGTGAGTSAYAIIEQGQVEALLKASNEDRRAIFEEAAGVSRFRVKKIECLRRLERVGDNLTRLRDILGEVDHQLKAARLQAARAQKHRELSARLRQLRVGLSLREYAALTTQAADTSRKLIALRTNLDAVTNRSAEESEAVRALDADRAQLIAYAGEFERTIADARGRIAGLDTTLERERVLSTELEKELARVTKSKSDIILHIATLEESRATVAHDLAHAQQRCAEEENRASAATGALETLTAATSDARSDIEASKTLHVQLLREAAQWQNEIVSAASRAEQLKREREQLSGKTSQVTETLAAIDLELAGLMRAEADLQSQLAAARIDLAERTRLRDAARDESETLHKKLAELRAEASGFTSRIELLEGLEKSRDGLGAGIREVMDLVEEWTAPKALRKNIIGLLADCLRAPHEIAPLIDLALGSLAQCFVVRDSGELIKALVDRAPPFAGRVGFIAVQGKPPKLRLAPEGARRAADLVECAHDECKNLPRRLLGNTLVVKDLDTAWEIAENCPGWRIVTEAGEILEADGTVTVGEHHAGTGLLSRKSELRELKDELAGIEEKIETSEFDLEWAAERADESDAQVERLREEIEVLISQESDLRTRIGRQRERRTTVHGDVASVKRQLKAIDAEVGLLVERNTQAKTEAQSCSRRAADIQVQIDGFSQVLAEREKSRHAAQQEKSSAELAIAQLRERLQALNSRSTNLQSDLTKRHDELAELTSRFTTASERIEQCRATQSNAVAEREQLLASMRVAETELSATVARRDELRQKEKALQERLQIAQNDWQRQRDELHALELSASQSQHRIETLLARLMEDYQVDLRHTFAEEQANGGQAAQIDGLTEEAARVEIEELRKKLDRLGGVSTEALEELSQIEAKAQGLQTQLDDLTKARTSLEEVIEKINADSKKLFNETFGNIRQQFQELFRQLFAGGMADIVLEKPDEPLESGIDIVARPPGKELRSISLLSGGEKTLTAVALLLAIFKSKPSPFCLLDEVDAALDEANAARLASLLREFAATSQFIIITHAKRTMAAADVLYGVTMQESGISKRVAIRFEDWEGEERQAA